LEKDEKSMFIDLEKVYGRMPRKVSKWVLMKKGGSKNIYKFDSEYV
jgi:hypothetical protein